MPQDHDYNEFDPKKESVRKTDILTPPLQSIGNPENPHWIIPNQKIVVVSEKLPGLQDFIINQKRLDDPLAHHPGSPGEVIPRPPALENSANNFFRSLVNLLRGWLRWLRGGGQRPTGQPVVGGDGTFIWSFAGDPEKGVHFRIVRASECPNGSEYGQGASVNVLLTWNAVNRQGNLDLTPFAQLYAQADNHFITNPQPPGQETSPPINAPSVITKVYDSDFRVFEDSDEIYYSDGGEESKEPIVAVMDTGLKYKWDSPEPLMDTEDKPFKFKIAKAPADSCTLKTSFGYCSISQYLQKPVVFRQLAALAPMTIAQIKKSPYDDYRVDEKIEDGKVKVRVQVRENVGRHGTLITAILNKYGCRVLPVKSFNCAGQGTLFDVLDGLNYLIIKKGAGMPIKVLNASFGGNLDAAALKLLHRKMKALTESGVWIVTSAGNDGIDLDVEGTSIYPAQFGLPDGSHRLDKVITVNSYYGGRVQGNRGRAVAITAKSGASDGFPSVIPLVGNPKTLHGTSFAAPYVACVLANIETADRTRDEILNEISTKTFGEVTFARNS